MAASILTRVELDNEAPAMGPDVDMLWWSTEDEHDRQLGTVLAKLGSQVSPDDVTVLTRDGLGVDRVRRLEQAAGVRLTSMDTAEAGCMMVATVHEFKGLEADVVVAADIAELHDIPLRRHAYVACTRARTHLTVMLHEDLRDDYAEGARWFGRLLTARQRFGDDT